jgi:hypothetical protein
MSTITRRSIARLGGRQKGPPSLTQVLADLQKNKVPSKLGGTRTHSSWGERVLVMVAQFRRTRVLAFAHPTKATTSGRLCSLTIRRGWERGVPIRRQSAPNIFGEHHDRRE